MSIIIGKPRDKVHYKSCNGTIFKPWCYQIVGVAIMILTISLIPVSVSANPGMKVANGAIIATVSPGQVLTQTMIVSIEDADPPTDITVKIDGIAQSASGGYLLLDAAQDTSQDTARTFVTVDKSSFHLDSAKSQSITVTITVPQNVGDGGYFAMINIASAPILTSGSNVAIVPSINVPVYLTIKDSRLTQTGKIMGVSTGDITNGQPVDITTTFQNTGNTYFKVEGEVSVTDAQGINLNTVPVPLTASSLLPGMSRDLKASFVPGGKLTAGTYTISSTVMLQDGTLLDQSTNTFTVKAAYVPPPSLGEVNLIPSSASTLNNTDGSISIYFPQGAAAIPVDISLNNIAADQLPVAPTGFTLTGSSFQVNGLTGLLAKDATVTLKYTAGDLSKAVGKASNLKLMRWDVGTNQWVVLQTKVNATAMTLTATSKQMGIWAVAAGTVKSSGVNWILIGPIVAVVIIVVVVSILLITRRKRVKPVKR
jgi:hypothetical protein